MTLFNTLIASSVVAIGALIHTAAPVTASDIVAAGAHNHAARHATGHSGMVKRKRNTHKNRKRCIQQPTTPGNNNNNNNNNNNGGGGTTTPPTTPSVPTSNLACSGGKVGLGWGPSMATNWMPNAITGKTCYYYNWSSWPAGSDLTGGLHYVPMFWGPGHEDEWTSNIINGGINYGVALAMNEVNQQGQSQMDIWTGASYWRQYVLPLRNKGYRLGSPATTSAPDGLPWLQDWTNQLGDNEKPDFYTLHWYGTSGQDFIDYVNKAIGLWGKPVWITEFACTDFNNQGWECDTMAFANQVVPFLDNNGMVEAYFPFAFVNDFSGVNTVNRLMWDGGSWTALGSRYFQ